MIQKNALLDDRDAVLGFHHSPSVAQLEQSLTIQDLHQAIRRPNGSMIFCVG